MNGSMIDRNQILSEASLGWGKGCIRFWAISDQNSGFHGNRKLPYGYNGEKGVSTFSQLFFIHSFSYLEVMMTCMRAQMCSNFGLIGPPTAELAALERLKNPHRLIMRKMMSTPFLGCSWSDPFHICR